MAKRSNTPYLDKRLSEIRAKQTRASLSVEEDLERTRTEAREMKKMRERYRSGYVYFLRAGEVVKIGFTADPKERQSKLQTGCPVPAFICKLIEGTVEREAHYHERFAEYRLRGEWFALRGGLAKYLERHRRPVKLPERKQQSDEWIEAMEIRL